MPRNRLCLVTDIEGYSSHTAPEHVDAQQRLLEIMKFACRQAGILRVRACDRQDRGDGRLFILSPRLDETLAIPKLVLGLRHGLYLANREPGAFGRIRLRTSMARGSIGYGRTGYVGQPPITACRLLDSRQAKDALASGPGSDLVYITTDELFQDVIRQDYPGLPSKEFTGAHVDDKEYHGTAWIYLPARGSALAPGDVAGQWDAIVAGAVGLGLAATVWRTGLLDVDGDDWWLSEPDADVDDHLFGEGSADSGEIDGTEADPDSWETDDGISHRDDDRHDDHSWDWDDFA